MAAILAVTMLLAVSCSSAGQEAAAPASCSDDPRPVTGLSLPLGLTKTAEKRLPLDMPGAAEASMSLLELHSEEQRVDEVAVFWFTSDRDARLVPTGATVEAVEGTTGPEGIVGVTARDDGGLRTAVMSRDLPTSVLMQLAESATVDERGAVRFVGYRTAEIASLVPSDIPGVGSVPVSAARRGVVTSYTDNDTRPPEADQRAVVVARFCSDHDDNGRVGALRWWYGTTAETT
jgi:hypothetical protein